MSTQSRWSELLSDEVARYLRMEEARMAARNRHLRRFFEGCRDRSRAEILFTVLRGFLGDCGHESGAVRRPPKRLVVTVRKDVADLLLVAGSDGGGMVWFSRAAQPPRHWPDLEAEGVPLAGGFMVYDGVLLRSAGPEQEVEFAGYEDATAGELH